MSGSTDKGIQAWNDFCRKDADLQAVIGRALAAHGGAEAESEIKNALQQRQENVDRLVEKIVASCSTNELAWYLERATNAIRCFQEHVAGRYALSFPELRQPWIKALELLHYARPPSAQYSSSLAAMSGRLDERWLIGEEGVKTRENVGLLRAELTAQRNSREKGNKRC